jgi:hypothetical protein
LPLDVSTSARNDSTMKKLLVLLALAGLAYWLVKDRLGGEPDEFVFTEAPPAGAAETPATPPPPPPTT